jgi:cbb3-type cytochrome oxidase maturation protein
MYFPYFVAYILIGLAVGLAFFFWAVKNDQFRDQQRARFLPLAGVNDGAPAAKSRMGRIETIGLALLACGGLAASAAVLIFSLIH